MNEQLNQVSQGASWFENFVQTYPAALAVLVAVLGSWLITITASRILRLALPSKWVGITVWIVDVAAAGLIGGRMWPYAHPFIWGLVIGNLSPVAYRFMTWLACLKWPRLKPLLSLKELQAEDSPPGDHP